MEELALSTALDMLFDANRGQAVLVRLCTRIIPSTFGVVQHRTAANRTTGTSIASTTHTHTPHNLA